MIPVCLAQMHILRGGLLRFCVLRAEQRSVRSSERLRVHALRPNIRALSSEGMASMTYFVQSCERVNAGAVHGA